MLVHMLHDCSHGSVEVFLHCLRVGSVPYGKLYSFGFL